MTIQTVTIDALAGLPERRVKWLDERETCNLVHAALDAGFWPEPADLAGCFWYAALRCARSGRAGTVRCAFHDVDGAVWIKAQDWQRLPEGGYLFAPKTRKGKG